MEIARPTRLREATEAMAEWPDGLPLAGGTDLMVEINFGHRHPAKVVALRRVGELKEAAAERIGAGVSWRRLEAGPHPALAQIARTVGSPQIRSAGTIGGNLGTASPAGDGLTFVAAANGSVELVSSAGTRSLHWDEFLIGVKRNARRPDEVIAAVTFPSPVPTTQAFAKVGTRNAMVIATVSCCVIRHDGGKFAIALGSVAPTVMRATQAEAYINQESRPSNGAMSELQQIVSQEVRPIDDHRATAAYRRHAAGVLARRLVEGLL
ncbi:MAG TPA: FAD binding domain-containing protein [Acidimicrobiia bacterium]